MTPEALTPPHPKREVIATVPKKPVGFIVTLDRRIIAPVDRGSIAEYGDGGVIENRAAARKLFEALKKSNPQGKFELFGVFPVTS